MSRATGANATARFGYTNTYGDGTPPASIYQLPFVSTTIGGDQALITDPVLGRGRHPQRQTLDVVEDSGDIVVPLDVRNLWFWLKLLMGAPVTSAAGDDFSHVFTAGASALPNGLLEIGHPEVPSYRRNLGVMANTFQLNLATSGVINASIGLIGQKETLHTTSMDATPNILDMIRFAQFTGEIKRNGTALGNITGGAFNFSNGLDVVRVIRPDGAIAGADPGLMSIGMTINSRFEDTVLLDQAASQLPCAITMGWTHPDGYSLLIETPQMTLPRPKAQVNGPGGIEVSFEAQASLDSVSGVSCKITLVNDLNAAAYAA